jgi:hypothetical protein
LTTRKFLVPLHAVLLLLVAGLFQAAMAADPSPCGTCNGFPDKDNSSGRFITVTRGLQTLGNVDPGQHVFNVSIRVSGSIPLGANFELGIFDGDVGGVFDSYNTNLGRGGTSVLPDTLHYYLIPDALLTGNDDISQQIFMVQSNVLPDNAWYIVKIPQNINAYNPQSGDYFYHLIAIWDTQNNFEETNLFKVSVQGTPFLMAGSTIGFMAVPNNPTGEIPNVPTTITTYDGHFDFNFLVPSGIASISLWDGDADYVNDTHDANSPSLPPFQTPAETQPEGANGGNPADDGSVATWFTVPPSIRYTVNGPGGLSVSNTDPSGNQEWELFKIGLTGQCVVPTDCDVTVASIPTGNYTWNWTGVDAYNNIFVHPQFDLCPSGVTCLPPPCPNGACPPPPPACQTYSQGYWKNHDWPVPFVEIGGKQYTQAAGQLIMNTSAKGDVTYNLFSQLVATKLNILGGNAPSCILTTIAAADQFLAANPLGSGSRDSNAVTWANILANYNADQTSPCGPATCASAMTAPLTTSTTKK